MLPILHLFQVTLEPPCHSRGPMPLPWSATFSMLTLRSLAMKPITEKMTKPAKMLVALLVQVTIRVSLEGRDQSLPLGELCEWEGTEEGQMLNMCLCAYVSMCACLHEGGEPRH